MAKNFSFFWVIFIFIQLNGVSFVKAHVGLTFPPARKLDLDFMDSVRTKAPCGMPKGTSRTQLMAGSTVNITWHLAYPHRGGYKLELFNSKEEYLMNLTPKENNEEYVLGDATAQWHSAALSKDVICKDCTIRLTRTAREWSNNYRFWSCADVDIVNKDEYKRSCSGHGKLDSKTGICSCDKRYWGPDCAYEDECADDGDCGGASKGKCVDIGGTALPRKQCFCAPDYHGENCMSKNKNKLADSKSLDLSKHTKNVLSDRYSLFYKIIPAEVESDKEIEIVLVINGTSYGALGWRSSDTEATCKRFPYINENELTGYTETKQRASAVAVPESEPEAVPTTGRNSIAEPESEPEKVSSIAEPKPEAEPTSSSKRNYKPSKPNPEPETHTEPESEAESTSRKGTKAEPEPESEPTSEPEPEPEGTTTGSLLKPQATSEPGSTKNRKISAAKPEAEPQNSSKQKNKDHAHSEPEPEAESSQTAHSEPEPESIKSKVKSHSNSEPEPEAESSNKIKTKPKFNKQSKPEPTAESEPTSEPEPEGEPTKNKHKHSSTAIPEPETQSEPESEPNKKKPGKHSHPEPESEPEAASNKKKPGKHSHPEPESEPESEPNKKKPGKHSHPEPESEPEAESNKKKPGKHSHPEPESEPESEPNKKKPGKHSHPEPESEPESEPNKKKPGKHSHPEPESEPETNKSKPKNKPEKFRTGLLEPNSEPETEPEYAKKPKYKPGNYKKTSTAKLEAEPESESEPKRNYQIFRENESLLRPVRKTEKQRQALRSRALELGSEEVYTLSSVEQQETTTIFPDVLERKDTPVVRKLKQSPYTPKGDFHSMDCTDIVLGTARGSYSRIRDYYTRDRSTPRLDSFYGGTNDILSATGWEMDGQTTIIFRRKLLSTDPADHSFSGEMHVIWARGQESGEYVHKPHSGLEKENATNPEFYTKDEIKYHGHQSQRGVTFIDFSK